MNKEDKLWMFDTIYKEIKIRKRLSQWNTFNRCVFVDDDFFSKKYNNKLGIDSILLAEPDYQRYLDVRPFITKSLNTFCDGNLYASMTTKNIGQLIQKFSEIVIDSYGITQPQVYCTFNSSVSQYCLATSDPNNTVQYYLSKHNSTDTVDDELSIGMPLNIAHENEHLRQFALAKSYLSGDSIPQFDQFCILCGLIFNTNLDDNGRNIMGNIGEFEQYLYAGEPMEVLARYKSYNLMRHLSRYVSSAYQQRIDKYLSDILVYDNIYTECKNVSQIFIPTVEYAIKEFEINYGKTTKGKDILDRLDNLDRQTIYGQFQQIFDSQIIEAESRGIDLSLDVISQIPSPSTIPSLCKQFDVCVDSNQMTLK